MKYQTSKLAKITTHVLLLKNNVFNKKFSKKLFHNKTCVLLLAHFDV